MLLGQDLKYAWLHFLALDEPLFCPTHIDWFATFFRLPAKLSALLDDVFDHVWTENAGALGDDHLAVWVFVELDAHFYSAFGAAFCPAVEEVTEANDFAAF